LDTGQGEEDEQAAKKVAVEVEKVAVGTLAVPLPPPEHVPAIGWPLEFVPMQG
jgi:hypothetical protein